MLAARSWKLETGNWKLGWKPMADIDRLLIRAPNWLGDAVMAIPAMAAVRARFRQAHLTIAAIPAVAPLFLEDTDAAPDKVLTVEAKSEVRALGEGRFDAALILPNSFRSAWNHRRAGIRERWGYAANLRSPLLTRAVSRPQARLHQSVYYLDLVKGLDIEAAEVLPRIRITPDTRARVARLLEPYRVAADAPLVGVAPGAAYGHAKRWPPARVAELAGRLGERGAICVLVGASGDRDAGREIESSLPAPARIANLIGRTDLRQLAGLLAACHAFVSNDSGAMHLAAAAGVPVAALFGPTDERVTAPLGDHDVLIHQVFCRPCMLRDCPIDHRCMKGITVDAVFGAVSRRLDDRARKADGPAS
jgi:heptosyltransferase-2